MFLMSNAVECLNVVKRFGDVVALNEFTLSVPKGCIFGLIGPNGAGKTTAIKICLGLLRPDKGKVSLFDEPPWNNPDVKYKVGVIHERAAFPPHIRVRKYLEHMSRIYGLGEVRRVREVLKLLGLEEVSERRIGSLSAGTLKKLSIAQAILHSPEMVIADEPTANLDPLARIELLELISRLHKEEGMGFLISSHILSELEKICDMVAFVYAGKVSLAGKLKELIREFRGLFRVSGSRLDGLVKILKEIPYVRDVRVRGNDVIARVDEGYGADFYKDVGLLAKKAGVEIYCIESRAICIEELFRRIALREAQGA